MANSKEISLLKNISELRATIRKMKIKMDTIKSWLHSRFDVLPQDINDALSCDDLYVENSTATTHIEIADTANESTTNSSSKTSLAGRTALDNSDPENIIENGIFKCSLNGCKRKYLSKNALNNHQRQSHAEYNGRSGRYSNTNIGDSFKCIFSGCDRVYFTKRALNRHQKETNHMTTGRTDFEHCAIANVEIKKELIAEDFESDMKVEFISEDDSVDPLGGLSLSNSVASSNIDNFSEPESSEETNTLNADPRPQTLFNQNFGKFNITKELVIRLHDINKSKCSRSDMSYQHLKKVKVKEPRRPKKKTYQDKINELLEKAKLDNFQSDQSSVPAAAFEMVSKKARIKKLIYDCCICQKVFKTKVGLQHHETRRHGKNNSIMTLGTGTSLKNRLRSSHSNYDGSGVDLEYDLNSSAKPSVISITFKVPKLKYKCSKCQKRFSKEILLRSHETNTHSKSKPFHCHFSGCERAYMCRRSFRLHMITAHPNYNGVSIRKKAKDDENGFKCLFNGCGRVYLSKNALNNHQKSANHKAMDFQEQNSNKRSNADTFKCLFNGCGRVYMSKKSLRNHQREAYHRTWDLEKIVNENDTNAFKCLFKGCAGVYLSKKALVNHQREKNHKAGDYEPCLACQICRKTFTTRKELVEHSGDCYYPCEKCEEKFIIQSDLFRHLENHKYDLKCNYNNCGKVFTSSKLLYQHKRKKLHFMDSESINNPGSAASNDNSVEENIGGSTNININKDLIESDVFPCPTCKKCCPTRELLNEHVLNRCFICKRCWEPFSLKYQLDDHLVNCNRKDQLQKLTSIKMKHTKIITNLSCELCQTDYSVQKDYEDHMIQHKVKIFNCNHIGCKKKFITEEEVDEHEKRFHCQICHNSFSSLPHFMVHNEIRHDGKALSSTDEGIPRSSQTNNKEDSSRIFQMGFQCETCKKFFPVVAKLKNHLEHGCLKCKICESTWLTKPELESHVRSAHKKKLFLCNSCGKTFTAFANLKYHIASKHSLESKMKKFKCTTCNKIFKNKYSYLSHTKTHEAGFSRKQCTICGFDFANEQILRVHIKGIHENQRPHPCHLCDKRFKTSTARNYHLKTHDNPNGRKRGLNKDVDDLAAAAKRRNLK